MNMVRQVKCQVPGCNSGWVDLDGEGHAGPFYTDPECETVTQRQEDLAAHVKMVHDHEKEVQNAETNKTKAEAAKVEAEAKRLSAEADKYRAESERLAAGVATPATAASGSGVPKERRAPMKCPVVEESCTESDWSFFTAEWGRYVAAVGLDSDNAGAVRHLWSACSDSLRCALHNDGAQSESDPASLLRRVKSLAVKRRNNLVNITTLQKMGQMRDEGVLSFLSRLNGQADLCDLQVECSCRLKVCFKEKFKTLQLIRGLEDREIQEKVLAAGAALPEGAELGLAEVVKMVEASESAKATRDLVSGAGGLNRLSDHQRGKQQKRTGQKARTDGGSDNKCGFCGQGPHDRADCPAKESECNSCGKKGHFAVRCRQKGKDKKKATISEVKDSNAEGKEPAACSVLEEITEDYFGDCFRLSALEDGSRSPRPRGLSTPSDQ